MLVPFVIGSLIVATVLPDHMWHIPRRAYHAALLAILVASVTIDKYWH